MNQYDLYSELCYIVNTFNNNIEWQGSLEKTEKIISMELYHLINESHNRAASFNVSLDLVNDKGTFAYKYSDEYSNMGNYNEECNSIHDTIKVCADSLYKHIKNINQYGKKPSDYNDIHRKMYYLVDKLNDSPYQYTTESKETADFDIMEQINYVLLLPKIDQDLKDKFGITRSDAEVKNILKTIRKRGTISEKQKKYVLLVEELYKQS